VTLPLRHRLAATLVSVLAAAVFLSGCGEDSTPAASGDQQAPVSRSLLPLTDGEPSTVSPTTVAEEPTSLVATSTVSGEQPVYASPDGEVMRTLPNPWIGESPLVFLVKERVDDSWLEVYLPVRPNGSTGFVPTSDVQVSGHSWRIEVRLSEFGLTVYEGDEVFLDTEIAVATDNTPTPGGLYYTTELLQPPEPDSAYGSYAYGLSGYSEALTSFNGGPGQLGIHGTNQPELIGQQVSHGCIRLRNEDIEKLAPVLPLGVPVTVIP
jgi:lipoprotein-anchoring transpeptidase ErfK/SrfK